MKMQKATGMVASIPRMRRTAASRTGRAERAWNLGLTIDDVMADLDPGTLVWRERERDHRL